MHTITNTYLRVLNFVRRVAAGYEPAVARTVAAAFFVMLTQAGVQFGGWDVRVDAVLNFLTVAAPIVAGRSIRKRVTPTKLVDPVGKTPGDRDLHPEPEQTDGSEDPADDLLPAPGEHRRLD